MLTDRHTPEDDVCPVRDELLGELYSASKLGLPIPVETVAPDIRAMLALFCYRRSHLHEMGLAIAASCDEYNLVRSGGRVGEALYVSSREVPQRPPAPSHYVSRKKITLATCTLREIDPPDGESDEETIL